MIIAILMLKYDSLWKVESVPYPLRVVKQEMCLLDIVHFVGPGGHVLREPFQLYRAFSSFQACKTEITSRASVSRSLMSNLDLNT